MKFTLSIELESSLQVDVLAHLADIVISDGELIANSRCLADFLQTIQSGLDTETEEGGPFIIGREICTETEQWLAVADSCEAIAELIRGYAVEFASTTDTPESD